MRPLWFDAAQTYLCARCPEVIREGDPAAWLPDGEDGEVCCFECGEAAERAVIASLGGAS